MTSFQGRVADHPIAEIFIERWSPRAFTGETIPDSTLMSIFEAARWAPSSYNAQPWRFLFARHGTPDFARFLALLVPGNQAWAKDGSVLIFAISKTIMSVRGSDTPSHSHSFDTGAAWANLALQTSLLGWYAHGMTGVDFPRAATELGVPDGYRAEAAIAIGKLADSAMEAPSGRNPVSSFVFEGNFPAA